MKKLISRKCELPIFCSRLNKNQVQLWDNIKLVAVLLYYENDKASDISPILNDLLRELESPDNRYLFRYISTTKNIINSLEKKLSFNKLNSFRYPIDIGFECLLSASDNIQKFSDIIEWWDSADNLDMFIVPDDKLFKAMELFKFDGKKNKNETYSEVTKMSKMVFRKSGDQEELEILSETIDYEFIQNKISIVANHHKINFIDENK